MHMEYENRVTYIDNLNNLPATAAQYVKQETNRAEKTKQQKSDEFKL